MTIDLLLYILALICFLADASGTVSRVRLQSAGLALWMLSLII